MHSSPHLKLKSNDCASLQKHYLITKKHHYIKSTEQPGNMSEGAKMELIQNLKGKDAEFNICYITVLMSVCRLNRKTLVALARPIPGKLAK
jgi:hypothetical protein